MRDRSQTDVDRRPLVEDGARAARIHLVAALMSTPCPTAVRSVGMQARWDAFLVSQAVSR